VLAVSAERSALAILRSRRIFRDGLEHELVERSKQLRIGALAPTARLLFAQAFDRRHQLLELIEEQWMGK